MEQASGTPPILRNSEFGRSIACRLSGFSNAGKFLKLVADKGDDRRGTTGARSAAALSDGQSTAGESGRQA
eukprot:scaffold7731_cov267-Pinguiococcus_pyrenoidosus.AAC.2